MEEPHVETNDSHPDPDPIEPTDDVGPMEDQSPVNFAQILASQVNTCVQPEDINGFERLKEEYPQHIRTILGPDYIHTQISQPISYGQKLVVLVPNCHRYDWYYYVAWDSYFALYTSSGELGNRALLVEASRVSGYTVTEITNKIYTGQYDNHIYYGGVWPEWNEPGGKHIDLFRFALELIYKNHPVKASVNNATEVYS